MAFNLSKLKELRQKYFLTQYDLCKYIGVSDVAYRTWERRVRRPKEKHFDRLNAIFSFLDERSDIIDSRENCLKVLDEEFDYYE